MSRIKFLNVNIDSVTVQEAKELVNSMVVDRKPQYVVTPNTDIVMKMQKDDELMRVCNNADLILTDGEIVVKLSKFVGNPIKERVAMTDFVWDVCDLAVEKNYKIFLFGGKEGVLEIGAGQKRDSPWRLPKPFVRQDARRGVRSLPQG